jgi:predicted dehydrogenase
MIFKKNKIAVIGAGGMAEEYLKVLSKLNTIRIVGICNRTKKNSLKLKKKYKIEKIFNKINQMYKETEPDGVIVALSPDILKKKIKQIFSFNSKYLIEKPVGLNLKDSNYIRKISKEKKINAYVALNRRYYASTRYLLKKIKYNKNVNRLVEIEDQQDQILNKAIFSKKILDNYMFVNSIHLIDYFNLLCRGSLKKIIRVKKWQSRKKNIFTSYLHFDSGDIGIYRAVWNMPGPWSVKIYLKNGYYKLSPLERIFFRKNHLRKDEIININYENDKKFKPGIKLQLYDFLNVMNNKKNHLPSLDISNKLMVMISKIYKK